jgi:hypothetical protein
LSPWLGLIFSSVELPGGWKFEYREFKRQITEQLSQGKQQVGQLASRVERVENIVFHTNLPPQEENKLRQSLQDFRQYLEALGYEDSQTLPSIQVGPRPDALEDKLHYVEDNAYYDQARNAIVVGRSLGGDAEAMLHEYAQYALISMAPRSTSGTTFGEPSLQDSYTIQTALADYLVCSFRDDPCLGRNAAVRLKERGFGQDLGDCLRYLDHDMTVTLETPAEHNALGLIWAGAFWELRKKEGAAVVDEKLVHAWRSLDARAVSTHRGADFIGELASALSGGSDASEILGIFSRRGLL